jgi:hypothetical protein
MAMTRACWRACSSSITRLTIFLSCSSPSAGSKQRSASHPQPLREEPVSGSPSSKQSYTPTPAKFTHQGAEEGGLIIEVRIPRHQSAPGRER